MCPGFSLEFQSLDWSHCEVAAFTYLGTITFSDQVYCTYDTNFFEDEGETNVKRKQLILTQCLAVMAIRPSSFHTLFYGEKLTQLRQLFDDSLTERINSFHQRKEAAELGKMTIESREAFTDEFGSLIVGLSNPKKTSGSPKNH